MERARLSIPNLYADHHTTAVRKILKAIPGVENMAASSAFREITVDFDPQVTDLANIKSALAENGYGSDAPDPAFASSISEGAARHTAAATGVGDTLSFADTAPKWEGRPLWPCPGLDYRPNQPPEEE